MLSLSGVTESQPANYYSRDDYYFTGKESLGRGELGLEGEMVKQEEFRGLVMERIEATGGAVNGRNRITDDLTFSAPKSVSILAAL